MRRLWDRVASRNLKKSNRGKRRNKTRPQVEHLEEKLVPSGSVVAYPTDLAYQHLAGIQPQSGPAYSSLTPAQVRQAYGISNISFPTANGAVTGDGTGETIAIVDAYDDPSISTDLSVFDQQFGLAAPPSFTKVGLNSTGSPSNYIFPPANAGWAGEIELDVEWAHAVAPRANILLVEANSASLTDLLRAVSYARNSSGVVAVSMSWGASEFSGESGYDSYFSTPLGHTGVTFFASAGDNGPPPIWPSISTHVVAVGGTTLTLSSSSGLYGGEAAWSGGGGGVSTLVTQPSYQSGLVVHNGSQTMSTGGMRVVPDVSSDSDPNTGFAVYGTYGWGGWAQVGGTSAAAPTWAGLMAIVDQGYALVNGGSGSLDGYTQTLPRLYQLPAADFHDVTAGSNGYAAGPGFDPATGRGTPIGNLLVPGLAGTGTVNPSPPPSFTTPAHVVANTLTTVSLSALGTDSAGASSLTYTWSVTGPSGVSFSANGTNAAQNTTATFTQVGTYTIQVTITDPAGLTANSQVSYTVSPVVSSVSVTPASASVSDGSSRQFIAQANDQFGAVFATQPTFTWSLGLGALGSISSAGLYTAPFTGTGTDSVRATSGSISGSASASFSAGNGPSITSPAHVMSQTSTTAILSVGATDPSGIFSLVYTWSVVGTPPAGVTFSANGSNAAQTTTVTFAAAGTYSFLVTVRDTANLTATSSVSVTINQVLTSLSVTPATVSLVSGATQQFTAAALDQFKHALTTQPAVTWSSTGGGSISATGLFTAGSTGSTITASAGTLQAQATVIVPGSSTTFTWSSYALLSPFTTTYALLTVNQDISIASLTANVNIGFPNDANLTVDLISPAGTDVRLAYYNGSGSNFTNTTFSDAAATSISRGLSPFTGTYQPVSPLAALAGQDVRGTWRLAVSNYSFSYYGSIGTWSINVQAQSQTAIRRLDSRGATLEGSATAPLAEVLSGVPALSNLVPRQESVAVAMPGASPANFAPSLFTMGESFATVKNQSRAIHIVPGQSTQATILSHEAIINAVFAENLY